MLCYADIFSVRLLYETTLLAADTPVMESLDSQGDAGYKNSSFSKFISPQTSSQVSVRDDRTLSEGDKHVEPGSSSVDIPINMDLVSDSQSLHSDGTLYMLVDTFWLFCCR